MLANVTSPAGGRLVVWFNMISLMRRTISVLGIAGFVLATNAATAATNRPNIILVMTDDQDWGQVGYRGHPLMKTPNLDAMAANGLRLDRFYAGAPNCSPTRAGVLTGRSDLWH